MPRRRPVRLVGYMLGLLITLQWFVVPASADTSEIVVTGGFSTTDVGSFSVSLTKKTTNGCGGDLDYGGFDVDAVGLASGVTPAPVVFCVDYADTQVARDAFSVQMKISSFELSFVPEFEGSDEVHFQIPNRYMVLTSVGDVTGGSEENGVGTLSADSSEETLNFAGESTARRIANAAAGSGVISAQQEIGLTLNIPAGVYPGVYTSTIIVETVTAP